jgi:RNA polymerase sigma-70 factor (ECF subfamily)
VLTAGLMTVVTEVAQRLDRDPESFRAFYDEALPRIYGYFLHRCGGSVPVAEDLTSETFLAAVRELRRGRRVEEPLAWLFGIARHKLLDHYRVAAKRDRPFVEGVTPEAPDVDSAEESDDRVVAALAAVAAAQRAALVLCYVDGLSASEAAAAMGRSVPAIHSLLERGRASFKRAYSEVSR